MITVELDGDGRMMEIRDGTSGMLFLDRDEAFELLELINEHIGMMPVSLENTNANHKPD